MNVRTRDIRERAARLIEERGWHQGNWKGSDGSLCLEAALWIAAGVRDPEKLHDQWPPIVREIDAEIKQELGLAGPNFPPERSLAPWNDAPKRTKEEVLAALRGPEAQP